MTRIIFETVFVPANKGKTSIHSKNITANRHRLRSLKNYWESRGKPRDRCYCLQHFQNQERKQRKAEEGAEERRQCRPARASPSSPSIPAYQVSDFFFYIISNDFYTLQVNFNSLAQCSNTRALVHACCWAQLWPLAWASGLAHMGWAGPSPAQKYIKIKNKKIKGRKIKK